MITITKQCFSAYLLLLMEAKEKGNTVLKHDDAYFENDYYNWKLDEFSIKKIGQEQHIFVQYVRFKVIELLASSKRNELLSAAQLTFEIEYILNKLDDSLIKQLINVSYLPCKSYFLYKSKDYSASINASIEAIILDDILEDEGFSILRFHKLQQINNIARIHYASKTYDVWCLTMRRCLAYVFNNTIPYPVGKWDDHYDYLIPEKLDLLASFVLQLLNEVIVFDFYLKDQYLEDIIAPLNEQYNSENKLIDEFKQWSGLMNAVFSRDGNLNQTEISMFLEKPSPKFDLLKFALLRHLYLDGSMLDDFSDYERCIEQLSIPKNLLKKFLSNNKN